MNEYNDKTGKTNEPWDTGKIEENKFESKSSWSSSSSGYDYPLEEDVQVAIPMTKNHPNIPKLNLGIGIPSKETPLKKEEPKSWVPPIIAKVPHLGLNLENIKKKDFQDEFMDKFDEYSKSWRDMIQQQQRF